MSDLELAYTAGLIDGEGSISMSRKSSATFRHPLVSVTSTTKALITFLLSNYGGVVVKQKTYKEHHKDAWVWRVEYNAALDMLTKILPFMREPKKVRRATYLLEGYKAITLRNGRYTPEEVLKKKEFEEGFYLL